ncbi:MAG: HAMP domain-containing sensor histidine kinase, partial [Candidatus Riflebacteria bacterium]
ALSGFETTNIEEIDHLVDNFLKMSAELESRTKAIIELKLRERMQEKEAELAFTAGLFESASSYLHNIGNALTRMDGHIHDLKNNVKAMDQFPEIFSRVMDALNDPDFQSGRKRVEELLKKFEGFLEDRLQKEMGEAMERIDELRNHMAKSVKMQLDAFQKTMEKKSDFIQEFNVSSIIEYIIEDFKPSFEKRDIDVVTDIEPEILIKNQKHPMIHGITNLIKNAIEAIDLARTTDKGLIKVSLRGISTEPRRIQLKISDNGVGISQEDMKFLFASGFTTKLGGHGLGLRSFNHFLKSNNGAICAESPGPNCGITFTVELGDE